MPKAARTPSKFDKQVERVFELLLAHAFLWSGAAAIIAAVAVWSLQILDWLKEGWMPARPLGDVWFEVFGYLPVISWKGVEKIVYWVLGQNSGLVALVVGLVLLLCGGGGLLVAEDAKASDGDADS